jgi:hypothetical protein
MRFTFLILLFCGLGADAQMIIKAHANYRPYAVAQNLLLDDYPNAAAAYSLRKLDKDYTGNCIRIRRSSDNAETDIGFVNNYLDTTAIKNFCGSGAGARIVTWFDQSGNSRSATQSIAGEQPIIMTSNFVFVTIDLISSSEKALFFDGFDDRLINNFSTISQPISVFSYVRKDNVTTGLGGVIYDSYNNTGCVLYYTGLIETTNNRWSISSGAGLQGTTAGNTNPNLFSTLHNGTSSSIHINGQSYASGNAGTNGLNGLSIGNIRGNPSRIVTGYGLDGRIAELIIYGSNQSSNRTGIENNINDYYNIYWNGDFAGLLDSFPSSAAAYSLRNLDKDYLGPLVRVRRSSDNAEQDIYGDYYGNLDTVGLKNFVGAGNNGFVTVWYDQSGNAKNATQTTAANQPRVVNAGTIDRANGKPSIFYDGTNDRFVTDITNIDLTNGDNLSAFNVVRPSNVSNFLTILSKAEKTPGVGTTEDGWDFRINNTSRVQFGAWKDASYTTAISTTNENANVQRLFSCFANGGSLTTNINIFGNGTEFGYTRTGTTTTLDNTNYVVNIGAQMYELVAYFHWSGTMQEIILYNADKRADRTGIETNINTYYSIY